MEEHVCPYKCHLFLCTKTRDGAHKSCGDGENAQLKAALKEEFKQRGWKGIVRVSDSGCLGQCEHGPNIMIQPQQVWFSGAALADLPEIIKTVESILFSGQK